MVQPLAGDAARDRWTRRRSRTGRAAGNRSLRPAAGGRDSRLTDRARLRKRRRRQQAQANRPRRPAPIRIGVPSLAMHPSLRPTGMQCPSETRLQDFAESQCPVNPATLSRLHRALRHMLRRNIRRNAWTTKPLHLFQPDALQACKVAQSLHIFADGRIASSETRTATGRKIDEQPLQHACASDGRRRHRRRRRSWPRRRRPAPRPTHRLRRTTRPRSTRSSSPASAARSPARSPPRQRNTSIVEVISAEDIGKLPDVSIAESLARLPGLTAQRLDGRAQADLDPRPGPRLHHRPAERPRTGHHRRQPRRRVRPVSVRTAERRHRLQDARRRPDRPGPGRHGRPADDPPAGLWPPRHRRQRPLRDERHRRAELGHRGLTATATASPTSTSSPTTRSASPWATPTSSSPYQSERYNSWGYPTTADRRILFSAA